MLDDLRALLNAAFRASPENPSTNLSNPAQWLTEWAGGGTSAAGVAVTEEKALGVPVAYACTSLLSRVFASLPVHVFRRTGKFSEPADEHWVLPLLAEAPNLLHSAFVWREILMLHALLWGNHYSAITLDPRGAVTFLPLMPWNVRVRLTSTGDRKVYVARLSDGVDKEFREDQIIHVPALGSDGLTGISPVRKLRNMYGSALATETFGSKFFANDARPSVIMETPGKMSPEAQKNLITSLYEKYSGAENKWKVLVLEEGAKMHMVQMPLDDAQFLQLRGLDNSLICAAFGTPPHMIGLTEKVSSWGTGVEEMSIGFSKYTMVPWCRKIEMELRRKVFTDGEHFAKFDLNGLERGDYKSRMEGYQIAVMNGIKTRNEVRELEDDPPLADGDVALVPANLTTMEKLQQPAPTPKEKTA